MNLFKAIQVKLAKAKARRCYVAIISCEHRCGHSVLRALRPKLYDGLRQSLETLQRLDPDNAPAMPDWCK